MALPKDVEEQAKAADELLRKMQGGDDGNTEEPKATETPAEETPKGEEPQGDTPAAVEGEAKEVKTPEPKTEPQVDSKEYERLKQAHAVLQGKYNSEIPRLYERIRELEAKKADDKSPAPAPDGAQPKNLSGVLKKLTDDYGEDFSVNVKALIQEEISSALSGITKDVESVKTTVVRSKEERFIEELTNLVPNWRDIYQDPAFGDFLDAEDSFSGRQLRELAVEANNSLDAKRLAKFYKAFSSTKETKVEPVAEKKSDKRAALITPATSGKQNAGPSGEKPDYVKADDIQKFYNDVSRGAYAFRPKEKEAMEERVNRAIANNWVVD